MKTKLIFSFVILLTTLTIHPIFSQWQQTALNTGNISSLAANQTHIFAGQSGIYATTNNGTSWSLTSFTSGTFEICANAGYLFAVTTAQTSFSYRSTNNGINWTSYPMSAADGIMSIGIDGSNVFVGTRHYGIRRSTNNGDTWDIPTLGGTIYSVAARGNFIFAGRENGGVYRSTNIGTNWAPTTLTSPAFISIVISGSNVYAGGTTGVHISTDNGVTWNQSSLNNQSIKSLAINGSNVFAGTQSAGVYYSSNNGLNWIQKNEGLANLTADALLINGDHIYVGTGGTGVWKRLLSEILSVNLISSEVPSDYSLSQNYPNPFNPSTKIQFSVPALSVGQRHAFDTKLVIYDMLGKEITTLVNESLQPGEYEVTFDAAPYPSGVYFYTLKTGNFTKTNKMMLIK